MFALKPPATPANVRDGYNPDTVISHPHSKEARSLLPWKRLSRMALILTKGENVREDPKQCDKSTPISLDKRSEFLDLTCKFKL